MRSLLASTALGTFAVLGSPAAAETVISTATTTPVTTSALGDIHINSSGSIKPTSGTAIVTINSSNYVKNEGILAIQGVNNSAGIVANPGLTGDITNTGTITIDENYTPTDTDKDGDVDGPFAQGSGRFGIHVLSGGTYTGNISNSGTITIEGNQSAGIALDSALTGSLTSNGKVTVLGDSSVGIRAGAVSGNVTVGSGSSVAVQGKDAVGVLLRGNIGGALVLQGNISTTGYRSTTAPADPSKLDSDDLLQGGSAVVVAGNVAGGILLDTRPADNSTTDTDEDDDGIADASETTASIASFGAAPAIVIGSSTQDVTVGAVASSAEGHGLVIKGTVNGYGVYSGVSATGLSIGGTGRNVTIAGGMTVSGSVGANANGASATAVHIGVGASVPQMLVSGTIGANGGGTDTSSATAILIDSGATVNSIINSGAIGATRSGTSGSAAAIVDKSGTLALIQNSGGIGVTDAATLGDSATAIDLRANSTGATVRQVAAASGQPTPLINGNILFGSGADALDIQAGSVVGKVDFGGGSDALSLSGTSVFRGTLANSNGLAVSIGNGATLDVQNLGTVNLASLNAGAGSTIGVMIGDSGNTLYNATGTASFGAGSKVQVTLAKVGVANGSYTIVDAGTLIGASNLTASPINLPFLFNGTLTSDAAAGTVSLDLQRKDASTLGLNASESTIFDAALKAADNDLPMAGAFLSVADSGQLKNTLQQLMPDHAGGAFEAATKGSRLAAETLGDPRRVKGFWIQQVAWGSSKSIGDTASYDVTGWGASAGYDVPLGSLGSVGVTAAYLWGKDSKDANELISNHYEGGVYWVGGAGPLRGWARATIGTIDFHNKRNFNADSSAGVVSRVADGKWNGKVYSGSGGVSYELHAGRLSVRPNASIEYYKLTEGGYTETGGGDAMDLTVRSRNSDETAANALLSLGYDFGSRDPEETWLRVELEGGRRQILSGSLGKTVASFGTGTPFTLTPEDRTSGWRGALRFVGGGPTMSFAVGLNAEQQQGDVSIGARAGINFTL